MMPTGRFFLPPRLDDSHKSGPRNGGQIATAAGFLIISDPTSVKSELRFEEEIVATITLSSDSLVVTAKGADRIWALQSKLVIPLEHVVGAVKDEDEARRWWHGFRAFGTHIPGVITAGSFCQRGELVFWDVHHPERAIAISLRDQCYAKLIVEVENPDAAVADIEAALHARPA